LVAGFPAPLSLTTTTPIAGPEATLGSSATGVGSSCYCAGLLWLAVLLGPACSSVVQLLSPAAGG
jgi:hypothetical protein